MSDISVNAAKPLVPALASVTKALSPYAEPLVRIATGLLLVPHGTQKLFGWFGGYGIAGTEQFFASKLGLPPWVAAGRSGRIRGRVTARPRPRHPGSGGFGRRLDDGGDNSGPLVQRLLLDRGRIRIPAAVGHPGTEFRHPWRRSLLVRCPDRPRDLNPRRTAVTGPQIRERFPPRTRVTARGSRAS